MHLLNIKLRFDLPIYYEVYIELESSIKFITINSLIEILCSYNAVS